MSLLRSKNKNEIDLNVIESPCKMKHWLSLHIFIIIDNNKIINVARNCPSVWYSFYSSGQLYIHKIKSV